MNKRTLYMVAFAFLTCVLIATESQAQCPPATLTAGLLSPSKIIQTPQGNLIVAEFGAGAPNTARVSIVDASGNRRTLLDGLPSGINSVGDAIGTTGLALRGRTLYIVNGEGDSTLAGPIPGTEVPNPNPSSPIFSSVVALHLSTNVERNTNGYSLTVADHQALKSGVRLTLGSGGEKVTLELVTDFPDFVPSPLPFFPANVRHSNPYGAVAMGEQLFVVDAGFNSVWRVDLETGAHSTLAVFPPIPNPLPFGPPVVEAVPTSIQQSDDKLLVTLFRGFPFPQGSAEVRSVDPATGAHAPFITGLTAAIDVLSFKGKRGEAGHLTLELSANLLGGAPGRLQRYGSPVGSPTLVANCLISPSSMVLDRKTGTLYITEVFTGRIVTLPFE